MTVPPKPAAFTADGAPEGVEIRFVSFWQGRAAMPAPRIQLVHTNAASTEGSLDSATRWSEAAPNSNTLPHYQVVRQPEASGFIARKMLPTDRRGIANATASTVPDYATYGNVQYWSIAIETSDLGFPTPGGTVGYTDAQAEMIATILAYESIVHGIPLETPAAWYGSGTASHTDPFGYPFWTIKSGKTCPGDQKKLEMRTRLLPRANEIRAAWLAPPPPPPPPPKDDMLNDADKQWIADTVKAAASVAIREQFAPTGEAFRRLDPVIQHHAHDQAALAIRQQFAPEGEANKRVKAIVQDALKAALPATPPVT